MEKKLFENFESVKKKNFQPKKNIPFHYDDKGRKIYDVKAIQKNQIQKNNEPKEKPTKPVERTELNSSLSRKEMVETTLISNKDILEPNSTPFFCKTCNCSLKDNQAYLDHFNGKRHNQLLGMNMKVEKVGIDKVKEKLLNLKRKSEQKMSTKKEMKQIVDLDEEFKN